jgi:hypothetical protein
MPTQEIPAHDTKKVKPCSAAAVDFGPLFAHASVVAISLWKLRFWTHDAPNPQQTQIQYFDTDLGIGICDFDSVGALLRGNTVGFRRGFDHRLKSDIGIVVMLFKKIQMLTVIASLALASCSSPSVSTRGQARPAKILAMGDSLMAFHRMSGRSISANVSRSLGESVEDNSMVGAQMLYWLPISGRLGLNIPKQFRPGYWDWVILNGGGNDLWLGCGCVACNRKMDRLVSRDGRVGEIPKLLQDIRRTGARVVYVGYLRSPGMGSPIEHCRDEGHELENRIEKMAAKDDGIFFLSLVDFVPHGDRSYFAADMIHPSPKASAEIGAQVAEIIAASKTSRRAN